MPKEPMIDRDTYRTIKKKSRAQLQAFLMRYPDGLREDAPTLELKELEKNIKSVKGIGEKRIEEIKVTESEKKHFYDRYIKTLSMRVDGDGNFTVEVKK